MQVKKKVWLEITEDKGEKYITAIRFDGPPFFHIGTAEYAFKKTLKKVVMKVNLVKVEHIQAELTFEKPKKARKKKNN